MRGKKRDYKRRVGAHRYLQFKTKVINGANRLAFYVLMLMFCAASSVMSLPQYAVLDEKQEMLEAALEVESEAKARKDRAQRENRALQEDPAYMELLARDVLDYYKPGEVVFEVERGGRTQPSHQN